MYGTLDQLPRPTRARQRSMLHCSIDHITPFVDAQNPYGESIHDPVNACIWHNSVGCSSWAYAVDCQRTFMA